MIEDPEAVRLTTEFLGNNVIGMPISKTEEARRLMTVTQATQETIRRDNAIIEVVPTDRFVLNDEDIKRTFF